MNTGNADVLMAFQAMKVFALGASSRATGSSATPSEQVAAAARAIRLLIVIDLVLSKRVIERR
jgi:hypothetical protein